MVSLFVGAMGTEWIDRELRRVTFHDSVARTLGTRQALSDIGASDSVRSEESRTTERFGIRAWAGASRYCHTHTVQRTYRSLKEMDCTS